MTRHWGTFVCKEQKPSQETNTSALYFLSIDGTFRSYQNFQNRGWRAGPVTTACYIFPKHKSFIVGAVKDENKLMFRVCVGDTLKGFIYKITDTLPGNHSTKIGY